MPPTSLRPEHLMFDPPSVPSDELVRILDVQYGLTGSLDPMRGERDQNTLVTTNRGETFVLKIASPSEDQATALFQVRALRHIETNDPQLIVPRVVPTASGDMTATTEVNGVPTIVRLLTFVPGVTFDDAGALSLSSLRHIGAFQGRLASALATFADPAASNFMPWALDSGMLDSDPLWSGLSSAAADVAAPCRQRVVAAAAALDGLRHQIVHNDGHRGNLIRVDRDSDVVAGVIDFGDIVETALIADLAITAASFVGAQPDPVAGLVALADGFHSSCALETAELRSLPELVLARLTLSTLLTGYQMNHTPHIAEAVGAEFSGLLADLARWRDIDPESAAGSLSNVADGR